MTGGLILVNTLDKTGWEEIYDRITRVKQIGTAERTWLLRVFGDRYTKALTALEASRVRKHVFSPSGRTIWTVVGEKREYQILPAAKFCSCNDFYFRVLSHEAFLCYHLIAQKLAEALGQYVVIEEEDEKSEALLSVLRRPAAEHRRLLREEVEHVRQISETLLSKAEGWSAQQLLLEIQAVGFEVQTPQHLAAILVADKQKRFKCERGRWRLSRGRGEKG
jgi:predicted nucleic acid-binding Zn finger protein